MNYRQTLDYLYSALPVFEHSGAGAYKPGLGTTEALAALFGHPERNYPTIHIAGTNGKGSTASTIAAILTAAGYRTGLYTSPHIADFDERIRIDGKTVSHDFVVDFTRRFLESGSTLRPSFFELATIMAFDWFAAGKVDVAVIETGLGGRLDSTNILTPVLSVITNISADHTALLGDTLTQIAAEKAGIIKDGVPVVVGEAEGDVRAVFERVAAERRAPIIFAGDHPLCRTTVGADGHVEYTDTPWGDFSGELRGAFQALNGRTVLSAMALLSERFDIGSDAVARGFGNVCSLAGLQGRWQSLNRNGRNFIIDTGHNAGAWQYLGPALAQEACKRRVVAVLGFVADKDVAAIMPYMPHNVEYIFTAPSTPRRREAASTAAISADNGIAGKVSPTVKEAVDIAVSTTAPDDLIYIGGSTFVVADFLLCSSENF